MLTQKARPEDVSLAEYLIGHLLREGALTEEELRILRPAPCNRLDRNTSGIVICGKTMAGLQEASAMIRERTLQKYYLCPVLGEIREEMLLEGYLVKDERTNRVSVTAENVPGSTRIITGYRPAGYCRIQNGRRTVISTLLEVHLVTGKSHQIRAHLESIGHPVLGDPKYGDPGVNEALRRDFGLRSQLLHCHRVVFPHLEGQLAAWSGREITAPVPGRFLQITKNSIVI